MTLLGLERHVTYHDTVLVCGTESWYGNLRVGWVMTCSPSIAVASRYLDVFDAFIRIPLRRLGEGDCLRKRPARRLRVYSDGSLR
jgi:hypothetical protein